uniref:Uncharacterized protein n=1 Tax=Arundo donax TaxID=35708 RepID=A0A0A8YDI3_ARUDO
MDTRNLLYRVIRFFNGPTYYSSFLSSNEAENEMLH